jgi:hypothetical protein
MIGMGDIQTQGALICCVEARRPFGHAVPRGQRVRQDGKMRIWTHESLH